MEESARIVFEVVHSIWEEWPQQRRPFQSERPEMQDAFRECLEARLPPGWRATTTCGLSLPGRCTQWRRYDVYVLDDQRRRIALLELSLDDTNVHHALHNGELKLLGNCKGVSISTDEPFSRVWGLTEGDIALISDRLQSIPLRGLFFVGPRRVLDDPEDVTWWPTPRIDDFWSALFAPRKSATLRQVFARLAEEGLYCWFYSLCGEESLEYLPTGQRLS